MAYLALPYYSNKCNPSAIKKLIERWKSRYAIQSMQSAASKLSSSKTALKRCTSIESCW